MARILIVEDDPNSARVLRCLLRSAGHDVFVSLDAAEIVRMCQRGELDLGLLDVSLAGCTLDGNTLDGVGLCRMIKANVAARHFPVILVTAHAMHGDAGHLLAESGADDYLSKPIQDHDGLLSLVATHLAKAQAAVCAGMPHCGAGFQLPYTDKQVGNLLHGHAE